MLKSLFWIVSNLRRLIAGRSGPVGLALLASVLAGDVAAQSVRFTSSAYSVPEDHGFIRIVVTRVGDVSGSGSVTFSTSDGTAVNGQDYVGRTGILNFKPNEIQKTFDVVILDNVVTNLNKTINLRLSNLVGLTPSNPQNAVITIIDDEKGITDLNAGQFDFTAAVYTVTDREGTVSGNNLPSYAGAEITVTRTGGNRGKVTVNYSTVDMGVAKGFTNYIPVSGTLVFNDFQMSTNFIVPILKDEFFISNLQQAALCTVTNTNGTIDYICTTNFFDPLPFTSYLTNNGQFSYYQFYTNTVTLNGELSTNSIQISPTLWFGVTLSDPRLDPAEDPSIVAPQLGPTSDATVGIVQTDFWRDVNGDPAVGVGLGFAIERSYFRTPEQVTINGQRWYQIRVCRDFTQPLNQSVFCRYVVNASDFNPIGGNHGNRTFQLTPEADYAHPFSDYIPPGTPEWWTHRGLPVGEDATVNWGQNDIAPKTILIPIVEDDRVEFDEDMQVQLFRRAGDTYVIASPPPTPFNAGSRPRFATLTIVSDTHTNFTVSSLPALGTVQLAGGEQPAGAVDRTYNRHNDPTTIDKPLNQKPGANFQVLATAVLPDSRLYLGGEFTTVNTQPRRHIARLNPNGQVDRSFAVGSGTDFPVTAIAPQADGKVIIAGEFTSYQGIPAIGVARILSNGQIDPSFNTGTGPNAPVRAAVLLNDGKVLIGGEFTSVNGTNRNYIARLNSDGSLDTTFDPGSGPNEAVLSIAVASQAFTIDQNAFASDLIYERQDTYELGSTQGTLVLDYDFGNTPDNIRVYYDNQLLQQIGPAVGQGSVTISFNGASSKVRIHVNEGIPGNLASWQYRLSVFPTTDQRPIIGGRFTQYAGVQRGRIARLNLDGSLDQSFDPGTGVEDGAVFSIIKHGNKPVVGGAFSTVNHFSRNNIARFNTDGSIDTTFDPGTGFDDIVYSLVMDPSGRPIAGGLFTAFNTSRRVGLARLDHDGKLDTTFMDTAYNQFAGIPTERSSDPENFIRAMSFLRLTNNYNFTTQVVTNDAGGGTVTNDVTVTFTRFEDQLYIGGFFQGVGGGNTRDEVSPRQNFARVVGGYTPGPGRLDFMFDTYTADENGGPSFVLVKRDLGHLGVLLGSFNTFDFEQSAGAATEGFDYNFAQGSPVWISNWADSQQISESFTGANNVQTFVSHQGEQIRGSNVVWTTIPLRLQVPILDDNQPETDEQFGLNLSVSRTLINLGGVTIPTYPALGLSQASMTIFDNDFSPGVIGFEKAEYTVDENVRVATITLTRTNGAAGQVKVDYRTKPGGTATANVDYNPVSLGTVTFEAGQTNASFTITAIDDTSAELDETIFLALSNPTRGAQLGRDTATLVIIDNDFAPGRVSFTDPTFIVNEGDGTATISVKRAGGSVGSLSVEVSTIDDTALAGIDYGSVQNFELRWASGETGIKTLTVPIIEDGIVDGNKRFRVRLSNPKVSGVSQPAALGNQQESFVVILDNDAFGNLRFSQTAYVVDENGTNATITVIRTGGISGDLTVNYAANPELAIPGADFQPVSGTLQFTNGQTAATFVIPIIDDSEVDGSKTIILTLNGQTNNVSVSPTPGTLGSPAQVTLTIIDNELENIPAGSADATFLAEGADDFVYSVAQQADGKLVVGGDFRTINGVVRNRVGRLNTDGTLDPLFFPGNGPNASVRTLQVQEDTRILIAGSFTNYNGTNRNYIARLTSAGLLDQTFDPGAGANNPIYAMIVQPDGKIIVGGDFSTYATVSRGGVARVQTNGMLDASFTVGTGAAGTATNSGQTVWALAQQLDGKILVGGDFTSFNNFPASHLVRLNPNGSVDTNFNMSIGVNDSVRAIAVQPDGRILIGGLFTQVKGVAANRLARLNPDGSVDTTFNNGPIADASKRGANGPVASIVVQIDGKILVGGDYTEFNGVTRRRLTRLVYSGANDPTINFGLGADGSVASVLVQPDRRIVIVGGFLEYDGQPHRRIARLNGGSIKGSGKFEFASALYSVNESGTNVTVTVRRVGGTAGTVRVNYATQADPTAPAENQAIPNVDYTPTSGTLVFPEGEAIVSFKVPVRDDLTVEPDKIFEIVLSNPVSDPAADPSGLGDQPATRVVITSDDSEIFFSVPAYSVGESVPSAAAPITISRAGAITVPVTVTFMTRDGTATSGADYQGVTNTVSFAPGESERTVSIGIIGDLLVEGNEFVNLILTNAAKGGVIRSGGGTARLTIVDDDFAPGEIRFARPTYSVREANTFAQVEVTRTNGVTGVVTVEYSTSPGTATPNEDYTPTSGILTFPDGVSTKFIEIQIFNDDLVENNDVINIQLKNVGGGASLGLASATLTIVDDDLGSGSLDASFDPGTGANGAIRDIELDSNRRFVIGGDFTAFNNDATRGRITRLLDSGALDASFSTNNRPNNSVASVALYPPGDERIVIGGAFSRIESTPENRVARLSSSGLLDTSFFLPLGLNGEPLDIQIQPDGAVILGGVFDISSSANRNHIARLTPDGRVDVSFDPGLGADGIVHAVALQSDGKVLIGGEFASVNGIGLGRIARLNSNGSVDTTFQVGVGFSRADGRAAVVYDILILAPNRILVVGDFTTYKGVPRAGVAILNASGALDATYAAELQSVNGPIRAVALQNTTLTNDNKVIIGGDFTAVDGTVRPRLARLDANGKFDPSFDPGDGANASVFDIIVQPWDGRVVVVGAFTEFNNNPFFRGIARLNNDKIFDPSATTPITFQSVTLTGTGSARLTFGTNIGATYTIQATSDLGNPNSWVDVDSIVATSTTTTKDVPLTGDFRFFRIKR